MTRVKKEEFEKMIPKAGGDLWNQYKLCKIAFTKFPNAIEIKYTLLTGLWTELEYLTKDGAWKSGCIYVGDKTN